MNKVIFKPENIEFYDSSKSKQKRGAKVSGYPMSKELATYFDAVNEKNEQNRLLSMFFAGLAPSPDTEDCFEDEEDYL